MGARGPSPTPTGVLKNRGSWRANTRPDEPRPEPTRPKAPDWLEPEARQAFLYLSRHLDAQGLLTRLDQNALARYATLWIRYRKAEEFIAKHGDTYVVHGRPGPNGEPGEPTLKTYPQWRHALSLAQELVRLEREFGLTPSARTRLSVEVTVQESPAQDYFRPLEALG